MSGTVLGSGDIAINTSEVISALVEPPKSVGKDLVVL